MTKYLLMMISFIFSAHAFAQAVLCQNIFQLETNPNEAQFIKMADFDDKKLQPLKQTIDHVNSFLGELETPKNVKINVYSSHSNPAAIQNRLSAALRTEIRMGIHYSAVFENRPQKT